jgi:hypothetical protein
MIIIARKRGREEDNDRHTTARKKITHQRKVLRKYANARILSTKSESNLCGELAILRNGKGGKVTITVDKNSRRDIVSHGDEHNTSDG